MHRRLSVIALPLLTVDCAQRQSNSIHDEDFRFRVQDVFFIQGQGTIVSGKIESGRVALRDTLLLVTGIESLTVTVESVQKFRQADLRDASAGPDDVGIGLGPIDTTVVRRGSILTKRTNAR